MAYIGKSPAGLGVRTRYYYTATGGETSLSGTDDNGRKLQFTDGEYIDVYLNGVLLVAGTDYGTGTANTISSLDPLSAGNIVEIVAYDIHSLAKPNLEALRKRYYKTATGGETSISGTDDDGQTIEFAANAQIEVYLNGVALVQGDDYNTTTANTVGGLAALDADDIVSIVAYEEFTLGDVVSKKDGGTFANDVTVTGTMTANDATITGDLTVDTDTLYVDSTNDRVGVGTAAPTSTLHVKAHINSINGGLALESNDGSQKATIDMNDSGNLRFYQNGNARMRIDSSGNVLVGKTASNFGTAGVQLQSNGELYVTRNGGNPVSINRLTSDGAIVSFAKDGSTVGSIFSISANSIAIGQGNTNLRMHDGSLSVRPVFSTGSNRDNAIDLGTSSARFNDAYITNGVTTGSDQNDKQQIASLTDAEIAAAKRISNGFKTFKWNDAVTAKGDNARTHTGVIAQEVRTALEAEGLDAGDYGFFMSNTWWEADGEVYDTQADAPEGATERTRLGIRYPELLAFVGAASEQRMADLETKATDFETRIAALEANNE
jgi:hypothetical protein